MVKHSSMVTVVEFLIGAGEIHGSLFAYLPATVTVNGLENEMSSAGP